MIGMCNAFTQQSNGQGVLGLIMFVSYVFIIIIIIIIIRAASNRATSGAVCPDWTKPHGPRPTVRDEYSSDHRQ